MKSDISFQKSWNSRYCKTRSRRLAGDSMILSGGGRNCDANKRNTSTGMHLIAKIIVFLSLMGLGTALHAATLYVSKDGFDLNPCSRKAPCLTIQHAVDQSRKNGRIVVGPGVYEEDVLIDRNEQGEALSGLKIESNTGMWATFVEGGAYGFSIYQPRVRLGKKGKGFTIQSAEAWGVYVDDVGGVDISRVRVEGNRMLDNQYGILVNALSDTHKNERIQIRNNMLVRNREAGLSCNGCNRALIRENQAIENTFAGFSFFLSNRLSVTRNTATENGTDGFYFRASGDLSFTRNIASFSERVGLFLGDIGNINASIRDNVFDNNQQGIYTSNSDGYRVQGNIFGQNGLGVEVDQSSTEKHPQIRSNLTVGGESGYVLLAGTTEARFESNTVVSTTQNSVSISDGSTFSKFSRNNAIDRGECGIVVGGDNAIKYDRQYFGDEGGFTVCGTVDPASTESSKPNATRVNVARSLQ